MLVTGSRYLTGFIVEQEAESTCIMEKVKGCTESVETLVGLARRHPQIVYAGLQNSLKEDWALIRRVKPIVRDSFGPVEEALRRLFLQYLFQGKITIVLTRGFIHLPVNQSRLALPDPTLSALDHWTALCVVTVHLVAVIWGRRYLHT